MSHLAHSSIDHILKACRCPWNILNGFSYRSQARYSLGDRDFGHPRKRNPPCIGAESWFSTGVRRHHIFCCSNHQSCQNTRHVYTESKFVSVNLERAFDDRGAGVTRPGNVLYGAGKTTGDRCVWGLRKENKVYILRLPVCMIFN